MFVKKGSYLKKKFFNFSHPDRFLGLEIKEISILSPTQAGGLCEDLRT